MRRPRREDLKGLPCAMVSEDAESELILIQRQLIVVHIEEPTENRPCESGIGGKE